MNVKLDLDALLLFSCAVTHLANRFVMLLPGWAHNGTLLGDDVSEKKLALAVGKGYKLDANCEAHARRS